MNDYGRGAWEALNYTIRFLKTHEKDETLVILEQYKEEIESGVAVNFGRKLKTI